MKRVFFYLKENWVAALFALLAINWLLSILMEPWGPAILIASLVLVVLGGFLSDRVFKLHRKGPIPWYGSPILWLSVVFVCVGVYWFASIT